MPKTVINIPDAPQPGGPYNQAVVANGLVFVAGFGPRDPKTREILGDDIAAQTRITLRHIESVLASHGLGLSDLVQVTAYLQDPARDKAAFNAAYAEVVPQPWPARATIGAQLAGFLVELDAIAVDHSSEEPAA
ncbi:Rid family detoxifying hydrolase [Leifsonia bigeumensis]|uniref:Rid family detoxifying hydrolase n=1 Tax=Leifsonella bigeumensis TaxID=433643 RepID=A0ABP7F8R1_9MICO